MVTVRCAASKASLRRMYSSISAVEKTKPLANLTVIHRMIHTFQEAKRLEDAQLRAVPNGDAAKSTIKL